MKKSIYLFSSIMLLCLNSYAVKQIITVQSFFFSPTTVTINLGDTIQFSWLNGTHTTTSLTIPAGAAPWTAPMNSSATTFIYVPAVPGTYNYLCDFHPTMLGAFTVVGCTPPSGQVSGSGATTVCKPATVTLNLFATPGVGIQWQKNGANISGAIGTSYTATATGSYRVKLTNNCGATFITNAISATVNGAPNVIITNGGDTIFKCAADSATIVATSTTSGTLTYQWLKSNVPIAGATASVYKTKKTGAYRVIVTKTSTGCTKSSATVKVINNCRTAAEPVTDDFNLQLNPNPASQNINLSFESGDETADLSIMNINGQVIMRKQIASANDNFEASLDISNLNTGLYVLLIKTETGITSKRFVKQ